MPFAYNGVKFDIFLKYHINILLHSVFPKNPARVFTTPSYLGTY